MTRDLVTELVCTRISHDLAGNIGAVANAAELLEEGDLDFLDDIKAILKHSSQTLAARMKFFRMAFGLDNANLENTDIVMKTAQDYLSCLGNKDYPVELRFEVNTPGKYRKALQMLMIMADLLIRGGQLRIFETAGGLAAEIAENVKIAADKVEKIRLFSEGNMPSPDAGLAPLYALAENGQRLKLNNEGGFLRLTAE